MPHFDPRYNRVSGKPVPEPMNKAEGAKLVARVTLHQEPKGRSGDQQDMDRFVGQAKNGKSGRSGAQQFRIEDGNHAKTCR